MLSNVPGTSLGLIFLLVAVDESWKRVDTKTWLLANEQQQQQQQQLVHVDLQAVTVATWSWHARQLVQSAHSRYSSEEFLDRHLQALADTGSRLQLWPVKGGKAVTKGN